MKNDYIITGILIIAGVLGLIFMFTLHDSQQSEINYLESQLSAERINHLETKNKLFEARNTTSFYQNKQISCSKDYVKETILSEERLNYIRLLNSEVNELNIHLLHCTDARELSSKKKRFEEDFDGMYFLKSMDVELYLGGLSEDRANWVALHEVGHYVWFELLSSSEKREWKTRFESETDFITEYSKTNLEEYYAEMYANSFFS